MTVRQLSINETLHTFLDAAHEFVPSADKARREKIAGVS